jgi:GTP-binding protein HflX
VGYTNAGKSTLFNRLTGAKVLAKSALFATLDPTLRRLPLPDGRPAILSDTVGFISDLPHELVEAFRATLDEVREADIILHVRDISGQQSDAEASDVAKVLEELGLGPDSGRCVLEVWNKIDFVPAEHQPAVEARARRSGAAVVSALTGEGIGALVQQLAAMVDDGPELTFRLAASDGEGLAWLYRHGRVSSRETTSEVAIVRARLDPQALGRFQRLRPGAELGQAARSAAAE